MSPTSHKDKSVIQCITEVSRMVLIYTPVFNTDTVFNDHFLPMNGKLDEFEMTLHTK